jgi:hypothetical protein
MLDSPAVKTLLAILRGETFHQRVSQLPGYDPAGAGKTLTIESFLESG